MVVCALSLYCYVASVALLLVRLSRAFKQEGVSAMFFGALIFRF